MSNGALRIAIVGAESTGKSTLAQDLTLRLAEETGLRCAHVGELLRDWCERVGRTPRADEQAAIAAAQASAIETAAAQHDLVVCDTTPLMTAVYSELLFADRSLHEMALAYQQRCALTLLTSLDLPWVADGHQRDGPHVQQPVDRALRRALIGAGLSWSVVGGAGPARVEAALNAITPLLQDLRSPRRGLFTRLQHRQDSMPEQAWFCQDCDVPECEHLSLRRRLAGGRAESA
jgi:nicotinamide riboside kinase